MEKFKRLMIGILVSIMMTLQLCNVTFAALLDGVPSEVANAPGGYKAIPVYFDGNEVFDGTQMIPFTKKLSKCNGKVSGTATFRAKSYAYVTGDQVKMGTYIECLGTDGNWFTMLQADSSGNLISVSDLKDFVADKKEVSVKIDNIIFTLPDQNESEKHLWFYLSSSTGGSFDRQSENMVQFATLNKGITVTRTLEEVSGEKNVWQVQLSIQGQVQQTNVPTDVVLVLDRSGSMGWGTVLTCNKEEHEHSDSCYSKWYLTCGKKEHKHSERCYSNPTRSSLVETASSSLVTKLAESGIKTGVVSFSSSSKEETQLTTDTSRLQKAVKDSMTNPSGGTYIADGLIKAKQILNNSSATNKIIILLTDGEPTYGRSEWGNYRIGDGTQMTDAIKDDLIAASSEVKNNGEVTLYTIAAGASQNGGKAVLEQCATENCYYEAEDSQAALDNVMASISKNIQQTASKTVVNDALADEFKLELPEKVIENAIKTAALDSTNKNINLTGIDWSKTDAVITQGEIKTINDGAVNWNVGEIKDGRPAIICYRIRMTSGNLGQKYPVSKEASLSYTDENGKDVVTPIPNKEIEAAWAKVIAGNYVNNKLVGIEKDIWVDIPEGYDRTNPANISRETKVDAATYETKVDPATGEVNTASDIAIKDVVKTPDGKQLVSVSMGGEIKIVGDTEPEFPLTTVEQRMRFNCSPPEVVSVEGEGLNCIQPESITNITAKIKLTASKSKDIKYVLDCSKLWDQPIAVKDGSENVITYDLKNASIQVKGNKGVYDKTKYSTSIDEKNHTVTITMDSVDEPDEILIGIYMKSSLNTKVEYTKEGSGYKELYANKSVKLLAKITSTSKLGDEVISGVSQEVWDDPKTDDTAITVTYKEIAMIH